MIITNPVAVILAAGRGNRLKPITDDIPKCLVEVNGIPIIKRQINNLISFGVKNIAIVVGYKESLIREYLNKNFPDLKISYVTNKNFNNSNNLYSLHLAYKFIGLNFSSVIQLNSDVVFDKEVLNFLVNDKSGKSFMAVCSYRCADEEMKVIIDKTGKIITISKKIDPSIAHGEAIGISKFSKDFWRHLGDKLDSLKESHSTEYFEYAIQKTVDENNKIYIHDIGKIPVIEIDFPEDLERANFLFK